MAAVSVPDDRRIHSERWAAEFLGLSRRTLQAMRQDGSGPVFVKISERRLGYTLTALQEWIASRSVRSTAEVTVRAQRERSSSC
ncbi:helix-turn-helix transcriptional regulator [Gluconobacter japonicus]|uniref:helix-turn-helix transcriptional regulator n=1 Tax=Gluconobacter japonicus TaxID=376620 RepID=UPI0012E8B5FD|nr:helix-turn-helix domain-containing protein [Gluconobacter japonicus]